MKCTMIDGHYAEQVDELIWSLYHDYDAAEERVSIVFDEKSETDDNDVVTYTMKPMEEYIGFVFHQYDVETGKKYKFTITREAV